MLDFGDQTRTVHSVWYDHRQQIEASRCNRDKQANVFITFRLGDRGIELELVVLSFFDQLSTLSLHVHWCS